MDNAYVEAGALVMIILSEIRLVILAGNRIQLGGAKKQNKNKACNQPT